MGLRHLVVLDTEAKVVGMITRSNMKEHHLTNYWLTKGQKFSQEATAENIPPFVLDNNGEAPATSASQHLAASHAALSTSKGTAAANGKKSDRDVRRRRRPIPRRRRVPLRLPHTLHARHSAAEAIPATATATATGTASPKSLEALDNDDSGTQRGSDQSTVADELDLINGHPSERENETN
jgi:hypothetical protein